MIYKKPHEFLICIWIKCYYLFRNPGHTYNKPKKMTKYQVINNQFHFKGFRQQGVRNIYHMLESYWSSRSEKTLLMTTPKRPGDQIWQIYPGKTDDGSPLVSNFHDNFTDLIFRFTWSHCWLTPNPPPPTVCESISSCTLSLQSNIK